MGRLTLNILQGRDYIAKILFRFMKLVVQSNFELKF